MMVSLLSIFPCSSSWKEGCKHLHHRARVQRKVGESEGSLVARAVLHQSYHHLVRRFGAVRRGKTVRLQPRGRDYNFAQVNVRIVSPACSEIL